MNILLVSDRMGIGGAETHIAELARSLQSRGHSVCVASSGGMMANRLIRSGIPHLTLPLHRKNPLSLLYAYARLYRYLRLHPTDILHAHARIPALLCHALAKRLPICFVTTVHARFRTDGIRRRLSRWGYATVAVSRDLRDEWLAQYPVLSHQVQIIPNGIPTHRFSPSPYPVRNGVPHLLYISRLDEDCCQTAILLCRLAPRLAEAYGKLHITLAGGGTASERIWEMAKKVNRTLGFSCLSVPGKLEDPVPLLRSCDLLIGVSRCALEGMACEKPVLLSGDEGFLGLLTVDKLSLAAKSNFCARGLPPPDEGRLLFAIADFFAMTEQQRKRLGKHMRQYVLRHHDQQNMTERTEAFYRHAMKKTVKSRGSILLCGYYGYGNCGDDALLHAAVLRAKEQYPNQAIGAVTRHPSRDRFLFGVDAVGSRNPFAILAAIHRANTVIFGGGTILQDQSSRRSLLYYQSILFLAQKSGCRTYLWANGLSRFRTARAERTAVRLLQQCDGIGVRDSYSMLLAKQWRLPPKLCRRETDLALSSPAPLSYEQHDRLLTKYAPPSPFAVAAVRGNATVQELEAMRRYICLLQHQGVQVLIAILHPAEDTTVSYRLGNALHCPCLSHFSAEELTLLLSRASLACGMRLHLLLLARRVGIPHLPIGSADKLYAEYYPEATTP